VLDAVDPCREEPRDGLGREHVRRDPGACLVRGRDTLRELRVGPQRPQVAVGPEVTVDPVRDDLDPAIAARGLLSHRGRKVLGVGELAPVMAQVPLGAREVRP